METFRRAFWYLWLFVVAETACGRVGLSLRQVCRSRWHQRSASPWLVFPDTKSVC